MSLDAILSRLDKVKRTPNKLPSIDYMRECLRLESETGRLYWNIRPLVHFADKSQWRRWNSRYAGKSADVASGAGYFLTCIDCVRYKSHRIAFALHNNKDPSEKQIDHINGVRSDNRPENLREASQSQNAINFIGARSDSKHGNRGVGWNVGNKRWEAWVCECGRRKYLGLFDDEDTAKLIAWQARIRLFGEYFPAAAI